MSYSDSAGRELIENYFTPSSLLDLTMELSMKSINLSVPLQKDLNNHLLVIRSKSDGPASSSSSPQLYFGSKFLKRISGTSSAVFLLQASVHSAVVEYHSVVRRPDGTFDMNLDTDTLHLIEKLSQLAREICSNCHSCRQVYFIKILITIFQLVTELLKKRF